MWLYFSLPSCGYILKVCPLRYVFDNKSDKLFCQLPISLHSKQIVDIKLKYMSCSIQKEK
jgi:hypothetical protein